MRRPLSAVFPFIALLASACTLDSSSEEADAQWLDRLNASTLTEVWRIGELNGPPERVFGRIGGIAVDASGRIFVVDVLNNVLRMYGPGGEHLASAGREGEGPGEFRSPEKVVLVGKDSVLVTDRNGRLSRFLVRGDSIVVDGIVRLSATPWDACVLGDAIIVQGVPLEGEGILHVYDLRGTHLASFGEMNAGANLIIRETFTWGSVVCLREAGEALYVPNFSPEIRWYRADGSLVATDSLPDYSITPAEPARNGGGSFDWSPEQGAHAVRSILELDPSSVLIQLAYKDATLPTASDYVYLDSRLWDVQTRREIGRSRAVPLLFTVRGDFAYGKVAEPFPQIVKYRLKSH